LDAATLNCPNCGAASAISDVQCTHCGSALAKVSCPSCFAFAFRGAKYCPQCGQLLDRAELAGTTVGPCPNCTRILTPFKLNKTALFECGECQGLWLDHDSFKTICASREEQSLLLGAAAVMESSPLLAVKIRYRPCPACGVLMARLNFARCSGVVIDICRLHGTWFDRNELLRIVHFIQSGGLEISRRREKEELAEEWRRVRRAQADVVLEKELHNSRSDDLSDLLGAASGVLEWLGRLRS
jgi:Zn-finger nucleic acid-binding protein